jgi:streptomycin 6-kinase
MEDMIGKQIGSGGTSTVYEWGNNEVIKIFKSHVTDSTIDNEEYMVRILNNLSLDIPKYKRTIVIQGKKAIIYERVNGKALFESILEEQNTSDIVTRFTNLHYAIHNNNADDLPSQYDFLKRRIIELQSLLDVRASELIDILDSIPNDNKLCHGDYHPLNIIAAPDRYVVIDWNGACSGSPILDVAWSYMTLNSPAIRQVLGGTAADIITVFVKNYINEYCRLAGWEEAQILNCLPIVAARRLYDNNMCDTEVSRYERDWLYDIIYCRNQY